MSLRGLNAVPLEQLCYSWARSGKVESQQTEERKPYMDSDSRVFP